ncbi:50S ribosomal protein L4 [Defluviicoccus vanus]|uniref:Large ribosomal subunit protein uL4 n=1 Tax=Defluviicoccus vanus TaxID=111831 RepID=A0A7H1MZE1_9PROT|nr:50S ribosomal protein L4 [Defluviicoccus vanus]QNT68827.1 50S ribosomal protein L4 [Defluviicoccus vanus]
MQWDVVNLNNETVGTVELDEAIFAVDVRPDVMARTINWQLAKRRAGTHKTKLRGEVARTAKKPFRQKGTGHARQGSSKGPHMRGGAVVFGPLVRSHAIDLPKKVRRLALKSALSAKRADGLLVVLDKAELTEPKSKALAAHAVKLGWQRALVIDGEVVEVNFARAARNLIGVDVLPTQGANVYDILRHGTLVLTRAAVDKLKERLA